LPEDLAQKTYELGQMQFLKTTTNWTASLELTSISDTSFILKMNLLNTLTNQIHATSLYKISRKSGKIIKGYFYYDINAFNDNTEDNNKSPSIKWVFDFSANDRHLMSLKVKDRDHKDNDHILWQWNQNDIKSLITDFYIKEANVSEFESEQSFRMFRPDFDEQLLYLAEVDPQNKSLIEPIYQIEMNPVSGDANVSIGSYDMQDPVWVGSDKNDTSESSEIVSESSPDVVSLDDLVTRSF